MSGRITLALGLAIVALLVGAALLSLVWTPYDVEAINVGARLLPMSAAHWLGTDQLGRDMASMILVGARASLAVSLLAVGGAILVGVPIGLTAAARPGLLDELLMRSGDVIFAFPSLMLAILLAAILGPGASNAVLAIAIFNVPVFARVARGGARGLWTRDFVLAARLAAKGKARISIEHILPNIAALIVVQATIQFSLALIAEAGLSYVGLGVQPPMPSWGRMLADAQTLIGTTPRLAIVPGLAILLAVLGFTLVGDGLRDRMDRRNPGA
jgi:peptide/nickel transport system permease protein